MIDDDPYGDAIWGIVTGYCAADALRTVKSPKAREIRSFATSMGGEKTLDDWDGGIASDERTAANFWTKRPGGKTMKIPTGGNVAKAYADAFNSIPVDYFVTSGHASERDWQIIYNKNAGS
jgi:zinc protease